jgi:CheY-like chemotaxis protein
MVYGFAQQSGGHVSIDSNPQDGTAATIVLPALDHGQLDAPVEEEPPSAAPAKERVLVVEDEPQVLEFVSSQLLSLGYDVTAVSTGTEALTLLEGDKFDLLFTDLVLPKGLSGVEVARRAREMIPTLRVLLTSGYSEEVFEHHGRPEKDTPLLRKPYRRRELAEMLRKVLET